MGPSPSFLSNSTGEKFAFETLFRCRNKGGFNEHNLLPLSWQNFVVVGYCNLISPAPN
jgi:hypothetical protein